MRLNLDNEFLKQPEEKRRLMSVLVNPRSTSVWNMDVALPTVLAGLELEPQRLSEASVTPC